MKPITPNKNKMTQQELITNIKQATETELHYYCNIIQNLSIYDFKHVATKLLSKLAETSTIDIYCSKIGKLFLLEKFWLDEFNYLGTKINIIASTEFPYYPNEYNYLIMFDNKPIGFIETIDA